jgi:cytidylate kinase
MNQRLQIETGLSVLEARLLGPQAARVRRNANVNPFVTLGRETGAGATTVGHLLVTLLDQSFREQGQGWVFLDKNLLAHALATRNLPGRLAEYLPEDKISEIRSVIGELVGLHPSLWELEHQVSETILQLAHVGRVIIVGRASYLVTRSLPGGLHVKLAASADVRVERVMNLLNCDAEAAVAHILETERARRRYVKTRFGRDIDDPHLYDLVINTDRMTPMAVAHLIAEALRDRLAELRQDAVEQPAPAAVPEAGFSSRLG